MDYAIIRKHSLRLFIGFLGLTALIAIFSVLSGEFGDLQIKILATCFTISTASIGAMSCAAFIEKKKRTALGLTGIFLSISAATLLIIGLWAEIDADEFWRTTLTLITCAIAFAHAFLLALPELDQKQQWVQLASSLSIGALALLVTLLIWVDIDAEGYYQLLAVVSILVGLETLVVPILMKMRKGNGQEQKPLVLKSLGGDLYEDATGKVYTVREIDTEQDDSVAA